MADLSIVDDDEGKGTGYWDLSCSESEGEAELQEEETKKEVTEDELLQKMQDYIDRTEPHKELEADPDGDDEPEGETEYVSAGSYLKEKVQNLVEFLGTCYPRKAGMAAKIQKMLVPSDPARIAAVLQSHFLVGYPGDTAGRQAVENYIAALYARANGNLLLSAFKEDITQLPYEHKYKIYRYAQMFHYILTPPKEE
jgi:hypothetical protein